MLWERAVQQQQLRAGVHSRGGRQVVGVADQFVSWCGRWPRVLVVSRGPGWLGQGGLWGARV